MFNYVEAYMWAIASYNLPHWLVISIFVYTETTLKPDLTAAKMSEYMTLKHALPLLYDIPSQLEYTYTCIYTLYIEN